MVLLERLSYFGHDLQSLVAKGVWHEDVEIYYPVYHLSEKGI